MSAEKRIEVQPWRSRDEEREQHDAWRKRIAANTQAMRDNPHRQSGWQRQFSRADVDQAFQSPRPFGK